VRSEISAEDLELAVVDAASDLGCDLIHRDDNHVIIIQTKYRSEGAKESVEHVSHFQSILKRLSDPNLKANERLLDRLHTIDWKNDSFSLIFLTFGKLENQARRLSEQPANYPATISDLEQRCDWVFLDEQNLNEELRSARAIESGGSDRQHSLYPIGQKGERGASSVIEVDAGEYRSFIMALDAKQIVGVYEALGRDSLFSLNIRNFIGNTATNKAIVKSATQSPDKFFLFNNGISCICRSMTVRADRIDVTGLQVINGAQTVKALVNAARTRFGEISPWAANTPVILVRITEIPGGYGTSRAIRDQVTQFNNTQNVVKVSDFRSNDAVQENLKEQFKSLTYRGKHVVYVPKRTDSPPKNSELVRLEEFAKSVFAFLRDPISFSGATAFLFDDTAGGYNMVFGDGQAKWERMPDEEFRLRAAIYWLSKEFGAHMREDRKSETDPDVKAALERKWMLMFATRKVFEHYYPNGWKGQLRKLYKGDWALGADAKGKLLLQIYRDARAGVVMAYKISKKHDSKFVHRNWMRSKETPGHISEILKDSILTVREPLGDIPVT
jgi:AIPR protein